jgi:hypothetical protein
MNIRVPLAARHWLPLMLAAAFLTSATSFATDQPVPSPLATLADLEARAPKENSYPEPNPKFHQEVVRLVESNTLASGDEFFRAGKLASGPIEDYRSARMRYELMLAAAAKANREVEQWLPASWDSLLLRLGRPMRLDAYGLAANNPGSDDFPFEPAPKVVQSVLRNLTEARDAAGKAGDNAEVQTIVDADQAVRANWGKLSEADLKAVSAKDHQRNVRIREIVNEGRLHTAMDFANASLVMQHSATFAGFELAHELAVCSMLLGDRGTGRWLVAATYDRMLNSVGHDQRFGTQGAPMLMSQTKPELRETDEAGICDAERLALGCPTLAAKRADFWAPRPTP